MRVAPIELYEYAMPPVTVAVVSWNERERLAAALRSLASEQEAGRIETWVVDNASEDGSADLVGAEFPWARLVALEENVGYGRAVNLVAERTDSEWIAPANNDLELSPGAIERLLAAGDEHPEAAVIAPRLVLPGGSTQHSVFAFPTIPLALGLALGIVRRSRRIGDRLCLEGLWDPDRAREVPWAIATFFLCRREAFAAEGGFDPEQFIHAEDLDLQWRLRRAGWRVRYVPDAEVLHHASAATTRAYGDDRVRHWVGASYAWMLVRRGIVFERTMALVNLAGAGIRAVVFGALARLLPGRFAERRAEARMWLGAHRLGLGSRAALMRLR